MAQIKENTLDKNSRLSAIRDPDGTIRGIVEECKEILEEQKGTKFHSAQVRKMAYLFFLKHLKNT